MTIIFKMRTDNKYNDIAMDLGARRKVLKERS